VRHDARALGTHGEDLAARWYLERGYRVLARNWRCDAGEVDLVIGQPGLIVFCEVKARTTTSHGTGADAVTRSKQARVRRVAAAWLRTVDHEPAEVRFDVAAVDRGVAINVVEGAF
jgi:putative endonuclease